METYGFNATYWQPFVVKANSYQEARTKTLELLREYL